LDYQYSLELEILNSSYFSKGTKISIDKNGMVEGSLRNAKDKITYFGYCDDNNINTQESNFDFLLPIKHCNKLGKFFKIQYVPKLNIYIIKDLGNGFGTFVKIQDSYIIRNSSLINIGNTYLLFNFVGKNETEDKSKMFGVGKKLKVKLFDNKNNYEKKEYNFDNNESRIIRVGRKNHGNEIEIDDNVSSKINCIILYDMEKGWILKDGNEIISKDGDITRKLSKNGTWILAIENIKIIDKMIFKSNCTIFQCNYIIA